MAGPIQKTFNSEWGTVGMNSGLEQLAINGMAFESDQIGSVADDGALILQIDTKTTKRIYLLDVRASLGGGVATQGELEIYEDPTYTTGTTAASAVNFDRFDGNAKTVDVFTDPTGVSATAAQTLHEIYFFGTRGAEGALKMPMHLKPDTTYIIECHNRSGSTADMYFSVTWAEV